MSYRKLFKRLVRDPSTFEIRGKDLPKSEIATQDLCTRLSDFNDALEEFNSEYYQQVNFGVLAEDDYWEDVNDFRGAQAGRQQDAAEAATLVAYRLEAFVFIHKAAALLNCDTSDIIVAHTCKLDEAMRTYDMDIQDYNFTDDDLIGILTNIHTEVNALEIELATGERILDSAISKFLNKSDEGMMYLESAPMDAPSAS